MFEGPSDDFQQFGTIKFQTAPVKESMWRDQNCECQHCTRTWNVYELQVQPLNPHQENAWINALMNQIQTTNSSMNTRNQDLTQQLIADQSVIYRLKFLTCELRWSGINNLPKISRRRQSSTFMGRKYFFGSEKSLGDGRDWTTTSRLTRRKKGRRRITHALWEDA